MTLATESNTKPSIVVLISGSGSNLQTIIDQCSNGKINGKVTAVISNVETAYGLTRAQNANIDSKVLNHKAYDSRELYDQALIQTINAYQPDVVVLAGFMRIVTAGFVEHYQGKLINIHPSLLPKYQGLNTHQRVLDSADTEHGCSVHFVTEELDGGPVILQAKVPVFDGDDSSQLAERVLVQEHLIYPMVVGWMCDQRLQMKKQDSGFVAYLDKQLLSPQGYANEDSNDDD